MQHVTLPVSIDFTEVFANENGAIFQADAENCWYIDFAGKLARFDYRNLLRLKRAIYQIDIEGLLMDNTKSPDLEIIFICACDHCYVLSLLQIIKLKALLQGCFVMLELNHIIQDRLYRLSC